MLRTRKAANLKSWDDDLVWYEKAVAEMKKRPMNNSTSWKFQAAIHGYPLPGERIGAYAQGWWNKWIQNEPLLPNSERPKFWARCQHGSWFFLPWHRMYLGYFEKIILDIIVKLGGPQHWALPYWNYRAENADSLKLPWAFAQQQAKDGSPNNLFEAERKYGNDGASFIDTDLIDLDEAFNAHQFVGGANQIPPGFGGPQSYFEHNGQEHGQLETIPHDQVHGMIGGLMGVPGTAGYDPLFWLHHANIDRLWEAWLNDPQSKANRNPTQSAWLKATSADFYFNDGSNNVVKLIPSDVLDTKAEPFYYQYDDLSATYKPSGPVPGPVSLHENLMAEPIVPEMAGASSAPLQLKSEPSVLHVRLFPVTGPARGILSADGHFRRAFLRLENIRGRGQPSYYTVYLNVPEGQDHKRYHSLRVGAIPTFGLEEASLSSVRHPGNGLSFVFNVTKTVRLLQAERMWHPEKLMVTFVPSSRLEEGQEIEVGRVSLHYA